MLKIQQSARFIRALIIGALLCLLGAFFTFYTLFKFSVDDEIEYRRLMLVSNPTLAGKADKEPYTLRQTRDGVRKDIVYLLNKKPLQIRLLSDEAELVLDIQENSSEIIEEMVAVKAYIQEELYYILPDGREVEILSNGEFIVKKDSAGHERAFAEELKDSLIPMQIVRYIEAKSGSYSYKTECCRAKNVLVERYLQPGHDIVENLTLGELIFTGIAESVEFQMAGGDPHFTAENLKASLYAPRGL